MMTIVYAVLALGIMGLVFGLVLAFASKIFAVEVDERIPAVQECLPGANCGGCGYPGCNGLATAIVEGKAPVNGCPVGGAAAAEKIAAVLGVEVTESEKSTRTLFRYLRERQEPCTVRGHHRLPRCNPCSKRLQGLRICLSGSGHL